MKSLNKTCYLLMLCLCLCSVTTYAKIPEEPENKEKIETITKPLEKKPGASIGKWALRSLLAGAAVGLGVGVWDYIKAHPSLLGTSGARQHIFLHNSMLLWHHTLTLGGMIPVSGKMSFITTGPGSLIARNFSNNIVPSIVNPNATAVNTAGFIAANMVDAAIIGAGIGAASYLVYKAVNYAQTKYAEKKLEPAPVL
ncbi:MAG: hypothetical protein HRU09_16845 [Oligoflexales bacterium]|nr:hypothetical protein [Oligoflexales bacterium]